MPFVMCPAQLKCFADTSCPQDLLLLMQSSGYKSGGTERLNNFSKDTQLIKCQTGIQIPCSLSPEFCAALSGGIIWSQYVLEPEAE